MFCILVVSEFWVLKFLGGFMRIYRSACMFE